MTNEELINEIQKGNSVYLPELWENVQSYVYFRCDTEYRMHTELFKKAGVEAADLKQSGYLAFRKAVEKFKTEKQSKFVTYLEYHIKNMLYEICGNRSSKVVALNESISLNTPISDNEGNTVEFLDTLTDETAGEFLSILDAESEAATIWAAVDELKNSKQRYIVIEHYKHNKLFKDIAAALGVSINRVSMLEQRAFEELRKCPTLQYISSEYKLHQKFSNISRFNRPDNFDFDNQYRRYASKYYNHLK